MQVVSPQLGCRLAQVHLIPGGRRARGLYLSQQPVPSACPRRILGIIGRDPSVSKSKLLLVDILQFIFINLRCTL